jgi:hypothetical protein
MDQPFPGLRDIGRWRHYAAGLKVGFVPSTAWEVVRAEGPASRPAKGAALEHRPHPILLCRVFLRPAQRAKTSPNRLPSKSTNGLCGIEDQPLARWVGACQGQKTIRGGRYTKTDPATPGVHLRWAIGRPGARINRLNRGTRRSA